MSTILDKIVAKTKLRVARQKQLYPSYVVEAMPQFSQSCVSLKERLLSNKYTGIIAEFKRASPSKGVIHDIEYVEDVVSAYEAYGAAGVSILTEPSFFKGSQEDLIYASTQIAAPILCKDFMIDRFQVLQAKSWGADVILIIAGTTDVATATILAKLAKSLGMEVLLEIHEENELDWVNEYIDIVGVNNRNLKTFEVDINTSLELINQLPPHIVPISESGINQIETIVTLRAAGFKGFLMGENFMKASNPAVAFQDFQTLLKKEIGLPA